MAASFWNPSSVEAGAVLFWDGTINNIDFHREGRYMVVTTKENSLYLVDALTGVEKKKLFTKSHGIGKVRYTHHESCVLMTSGQSKEEPEHVRDKNNCDIRYMCMHDNRYLRYFKGHTDKVTSISMSPTDDYFLSASLDRTICLWSLNSPNPVARIKLPNEVSNPIVQYDPSGLVFGVQVQAHDAYGGMHHELHMFDTSKISDVGTPFMDIVNDQVGIETAVTKALQRAGHPNPSKQYVSNLIKTSWQDFEFSADGRRALINMPSGVLLVVDTQSEEVTEDPVAIYNCASIGFTERSDLSFGATFSCDGAHVIAGNDDNDVKIYDASLGHNATGSTKNSLTGHVETVGAVKCNPQYDVMASGCVNTVLWIHGEESED